MDELPESSASGSNNASGTQLEAMDYLRGVESSTCLLLAATPSPTPLEFKHPLSEEMDAGPFITLNDDQIVNLENTDVAGDSSSSADSNSVVQDPVSAQLINNISMLDYQTLSKNSELVIGQVEDDKINGNLNFGNRKLPKFVNWNWGIIRKIMLWFVISGLVACLGAIIAMVISIPNSCNPDLPWYQGKVFYEIFPASFQDSNGDGTGDLKGIIKELDYIDKLGASAIRLNFIYAAHNYPEHYYNITSLKAIDRSIGILEDFQELVDAIHNRSMSIILDIPVLSLAAPMSSINHNVTDAAQIKHNDITTDGIDFWAREQNVDGFYLKDLERFVNDKDFGYSLRLWKQMIGNDKILIASEKAYEMAEENDLNILLSRIDLIDIHLDFNGSTLGLRDRIKKIIEGSLWSKPHYPWVQWNIGNVNSERVSTKDVNNALALTVLELVLPGTVSIFYGDEIGAENLPSHEIEPDYEYEHIRNLVHMKFSNRVSNNKILLWNSYSSWAPKYNFLDIIKTLTQVRLNTPTIYLRAIYKDGSIYRNMGIRETKENLFVIERWYPRRNTCVFVGNLGNVSITTDLSTMFYGGTVIAGTNSSLIGQVMYFDQVTFPPNSAIVLKLEK